MLGRIQWWNHAAFQTPKNVCMVYLCGLMGDITKNTDYFYIDYLDKIHIKVEISTPGSRECYIVRVNFHLDVSHNDSGRRQPQVKVLPGRACY